MKEPSKRLNILLPIELYDRMVNKVKISDIKNITELIKVAIDNLLNSTIIKYDYVLVEDLEEIIKVLDILYNVKKFKNPDVKMELYWLYNQMKEELNKADNKGTKISINQLDIGIKELVLLELSCKEIDILIKNNIVKEGIQYVK